MENLSVAVTRQEKLGQEHYVLGLAAPGIARSVEAGQFVMLGLPDIEQMLVRRPFSVARVASSTPGDPPDEIELLYKVFGRGTQAFSRLAPGDTVTVLGPLGRGFKIPPPRDGERFLLVAGGIGNAIYPLLLQELGPRRRAATLLFGAATASDLTLLDWFRDHCGKVVLATEDGSAGEMGLVTRPLLEELDSAPAAGTVVFGCGPTPMLRAVREICLARELPCQLALEESMACGFGVCLGCVVEKSDPEGDFDRFVRVCQEGPVFEAREVIL
jgi:dihydroorotate dehydrogenase electron transfer subunit